MESGGLKFSLILATVGKTDELARFLQHLDRQTYREFELVIIDQNPAGVLDPLVSQYKDKFRLLYLRSEPGLSRARNLGLRYISGDLVAFPDDDCWYAPNTLERVACVFRENSGHDGITGRAVDDNCAGSYHWFPPNSGWITKNNVWRRALSITIFLRTSAVRGTGDFDESLGAGSQGGKLSAEETDYLIRALECGFAIYYSADLSIMHPYPASAYDASFIKKMYGYSVGLGSVLRKHNYPISFVCYYWLRALGGAAVSLLTFNFAKSSYHFAIFKGRVLGWFDSAPDRGAIP